MVMTLNKSGITIRQVDEVTVDVENHSTTIAPIFFYIGMNDQPAWLGFVQALLNTNQQQG
jgi:hypothetical protein